MTACLLPPSRSQRRLEQSLEGVGDRPLPPLLMGAMGIEEDPFDRLARFEQAAQELASADQGSNGGGGGVQDSGRRVIRDPSDAQQQAVKTDTWSPRPPPPPPPRSKWDPVFPYNPRRVLALMLALEVVTAVDYCPAILPLAQFLTRCVAPLALDTGVQT